ncbi:cytochrome c peroxidase [Flavobacterium sp. PL11]|jgi:cytochrome c peroxidase|uniref:cytochrome c peroxidase n=1 Tax=Flavobacterium sp. PL11 TaxID=3071717 RepID=UPI002E0B0232|nr:cytochrome c peroxidase [Flavobacterium sp. PL11]
MKKSLLLLSVIIFGLMGFVRNNNPDSPYLNIDDLRAIYSNGDPSKWPKPELSELVDLSKFQDIGVLPAVPFPVDNAYSKEKAALGKALFFDPRLSISGQISCANCHNPELAWTDNLTRSFGHDRQNGQRNAMTIINTGYATSLFWDGRASSLEDQSKFPIQDPFEMNAHIDFAIDKIKNLKGYQTLFESAFVDKKVSLENVQKAIATFERTLTSGSNISKFDKFIKGNAKIYSDDEVLGLHLFRTKAQCINCHNTPYFSDNEFHNDGQTLFGTINEDFGRYLITKDKADIGKFRTPTLREVSRTGPWMHHGHFPSLIDVVQFYNLGNPAPIQQKYLGTKRDSLLPTTSAMLKKLNLSRDEEKALVAFLETLSTPIQRMKMPELPKN